MGGSGGGLGEGGGDGGDGGCGHPSASSQSVQSLSPQVFSLHHGAQCVVVGSSCQLPQPCSAPQAEQAGSSQVHVLHQPSQTGRAAMLPARGWLGATSDDRAARLSQDVGYMK